MTPDELRENVARALFVEAYPGSDPYEEGAYTGWLGAADAAISLVLDAAAGVADDLAFANPPMSSHDQSWRIASGIRALKGDK